MLRFLFWIALGAGVGALVGLVVVTLVNANCDSLFEASSGCTRWKVGAVAEIGAIAGGVVGLFGGSVIESWLDRRSAER